VTPGRAALHTSSAGHLSSPTTVLHIGVGVELGRSDCDHGSVELDSGLIDRNSGVEVDFWGGSYSLNVRVVALHGVGLVLYNEAFVVVVELPDLVGGPEALVVIGRLEGFGVEIGELGLFDDAVCIEAGVEEFLD
jgi:hypothetical protein